MNHDLGSCEICDRTNNLITTEGLTICRRCAGPKLELKREPANIKPAKPPQDQTRLPFKIKW